MINWRDIRHPEAGGAEVHLHEVFRRLVRRGSSVTLLTSLYEDSPCEDSIDGVRILRRGAKRTFNYRVPWVWRRELSARRFDVVVDDVNKIPFLSPMFVDPPVLVQTHHFLGRTLFGEVALPLAAYVLFWERLIPRVYRGCRFVAPSASTQRELIVRGVPSERIHLIHPGVDLDRYHPPSAKVTEPRIVCLGRLKRYKRVELLLRAMPRVVAALPDACLTVIGDGDAGPALRRLAEDLDIAGRVRFTGRVSDEIKLRELQASRVAAFASLKEGWGIAALEAAACGLPTVASDVPGLRDVVLDGETGTLVSDPTPARFAEALVRLLTDSGLHMSLSLQARARAEQCSWDRTAEETESLLRMVVEERSLSGDGPSRADRMREAARKEMPGIP